jgi:hypothetical protein
MYWHFLHSVQDDVMLISQEAAKHYADGGQTGNVREQWARASLTICIRLNKTEPQFCLFLTAIATNRAYPYDTHSNLSDLLILLFILSSY